MAPSTDSVSTPPPAMPWSTQQKAIFRWVAGKKLPAKSAPRKRHLLVRARAGTGKTTTIVKALEFSPADTILVAAFNADIAAAVSQKVRHLMNVKALTLHSVGYRIVLKAWGNVPLLKSDAPVTRADYLVNMRVGDSMPPIIKRAIANLHTKGREIVPHATEWTELEELAWKFDLVPEHPTYGVQDICQMAVDCMELAADPKLTRLRGMDFADMIYLPIRCNLLTKQYDEVYVDEAQDMTPAQLEIALGVCRGRVILVGDDRQGIYAFRGADTGALDRLKAELDADELTLTTTYRCGKRIVAHVNRLVPDFEAGPDNPDGEILHMTMADMRKTATAGDFVLSRKNAPLVSTAMGFLRDGKRAAIRGRNLGKGLVKLVNKLARNAASVTDFLDATHMWESTERERWIAAEKPDRVQQVVDTAGMIYALSENATDVEEIRIRIEALFTIDEDKPLTDQDVIMCSSIHRAKGLETDRVFVLESTLYCGSNMQEEQNLEYVACTRAKSTLVLVN